MAYTQSAQSQTKKAQGACPRLNPLQKALAMAMMMQLTARAGCVLSLKVL